jgi:hypothetical protein
MNPPLEIECKHGNDITHLFENPRNHHRTKAQGVSGDHHEHELDSQPDCNEAVIKTGMGDRRWVIAANGVENERRAV